MISNKQLAAFVAVGSIHDDGTCQAWMDSADRRCAKPTDDYLCPAHVKVARRRGEKAVAKEQKQIEAHKAKLRTVNIDELRREEARLQDRMNAVSGFNRHGTDDLAAYGGIGIRQTARQRRKYADRVDNALSEYTRLEKQLKVVQQRIQSAEWARGDAS